MNTRALFVSNKVGQNAVSGVCIIRKIYATAIVYCTALTELYPIDRHLDIIKRKALSPETLKIYEQHMIHHVLSPCNRTAVTEVVADGHAKVPLKCANSHRHAEILAGAVRMS